ncbi:MAG TPA: hypothetical protein VMK12_08560 [Anaeromyxobacteraceae bacterium]|nr:hypothetical protein [Anaeromyxobacteraceae bacterium]
MKVAERLAQFISGDINRLFHLLKFEKIVFHGRPLIESHFAYAAAHNYQLCLGKFREFVTQSARDSAELNGVFIFRKFHDPSSMVKRINVTRAR